MPENNEVSSFVDNTIKAMESFMASIDKLLNSVSGALGHRIDIVPDKFIFKLKFALKRLRLDPALVRCHTCHKRVWYWQSAVMNSGPFFPGQYTRIAYGKVYHHNHKKCPGIG